MGSLSKITSADKEVFTFWAYPGKANSSEQVFLPRVFSLSSNESRHNQYHMFIVLFDRNQFCTDCGLNFENDIFPLDKGINLLRYNT